MKKGSDKDEQMPSNSLEEKSDWSDELRTSNF